MIPRVGCLGVLALVLVPASASAGAGTTVARPAVALTASPSRVELTGGGTAAVRVSNTGSAGIVVDVTRAGFALDLRGRPRIVGATAGARSAASWIVLRPRRVAIRPGGAASVELAARLPARAEPGDHDALVLFTTRRRARDGVAVRMRMGVVVVVRAPGAVRRRVLLGALHVVRSRRGRVLELGVVNRGNVTEAFMASRVSASVFSGGRRLVKLPVVARELRPGTRGVLQFGYRGRARGRVVVRVDAVLDGGTLVQRTYRLRL